MIGRECLRFDSVSSTMDVCEAYAAEGAGEGLVVVAEVQTAGRGRAGRTWTTSPGDALLMSVLLRPAMLPETLGQLPLIVGVVVARAIESVAPVHCQLKWPNDVLIGGDKVAGILVHSRLIGSAIGHVNVGIGVNVNTRRNALPEGATSIFVAGGMEIERESLLTAILERLDRDYFGWLEAGGRSSLDPWRRRAAFLGEEVTITRGEALVEGLLAGVDDDGRLLLRTAGGDCLMLASGEVQRGPRPLATKVRAS